MITVICPVYNESGYIRNVLDFFIKGLPAEKELIIIDGGSTDDTKAIVAEYAIHHPNIRVIDNPDKFVPFALNKAILASKGDPVIRLDAHTTYADDYFVKILETFAKTGADIVGGPMRANGKTNFQKAVATATSTSLGVGDSSFHDEFHEGYVDSVYLGSWKRNVFETAGLFDTDMIRNQDDEFHYRAKAKGLKIYLNPQITSWYYPRSSVTSLFRQYYQYGLFKPLVLKKVKTGVRLRHLIPSGFVCYLILLFAMTSIPAATFPLLLYVLLAIFFAVRKSDNAIMAADMLIVYPLIHIAYGSGFIIGLITLWSGRKPSI